MEGNERNMREAEQDNEGTSCIFLHIFFYKSSPVTLCSFTLWVLCNN